MPIPDTCWARANITEGRIDRLAKKTGTGFRYAHQCEPRSHSSAPGRVGPKPPI